jgi:hypothetical protein
MVAEIGGVDARWGFVYNTQEIGDYIANLRRPNSLRRLS